MTTPHTPPTALDARARNAFWCAVEDCLVEIHRLPRADAQQRCVGLRKAIDNPPAGVNGDLFYHSEPFDVACDLAGQRLSLDRHRAAYDVILKRHNW